MGHRVALSGGGFKPMGGLGRIGGHALAVVIHHAQIGLGFAVAVAGSFEIKARRLGIILHLPEAVVAGKGALVNVLGRLALQGGLFEPAIVGAAAERTGGQQLLVGGHIALVGGAAVINGGHVGIGGHAQAVAVNITEQAQGFGVVAAGGLFGKLAGFCRIALDMFAKQVHFGQSGLGITVLQLRGRLKPVERLLGRSLKAVAALQQKFGQSGLGAHQALLGGVAEMKSGLRKITRHRLAVAILVAQLPMRGRKALRRRLPVKRVRRLHIRLGCLLVMLCQIILAKWMPMCRRPLGPFDGLRLPMIGIILQQVDLGGQKILLCQPDIVGQQKLGRRAIAFLPLQKIVAGKGMLRGGRLLQPMSRGLKVGLGALTVEIAAGQLKSSFGMACRCGLMQQRQGGGVIGWALPQQGLGLCEKWSSVIHGVSE